MTIFVGVDVGQKRDPTAIAVAERDWRTCEEAGQESHFTIRYLSRLPLGTPYPEVTQRVARVVSEVVQRSSMAPTLFVDATGVGQPVVDLLQQNCRGAHLVAVYFTYGDRRNEGDGKVTLGKAHLVSRLQTLLQFGRIHLPATSEAQALAQELRDYELRVDQNANERYGAFRVGTHDDLVTALGLAVQVDREPSRGRVACLPNLPCW